MKKTFLFALILSLSVFLFGCINNGTEAQGEEGEPEETAQQNAEEELLLLGDDLSFGLTYQDVKEQFPGMGPLHPEGDLESLGESGLREAVVEIEVLGHRAELEFNFDQNMLYSFYFVISTEDEDTAGELYKYLQDFYTERLGAFEEEEQEEGGFSSVSSYWQTELFQLSLGRQKNWDGKHFIGWGWSSPAEK